MSPYGAEWLVREHAELFAGVRHAIGEFGGFTMHAGGKRFYPIQVAEKQVCTVRMTLQRSARARLDACARRRDGEARARAPATRPRPAARARDAGRAPDGGGDGRRAAAARRGRSCACCCDPRLTDRVLDRLGDRARVLDPILHNTVSPTVRRPSTSST